MKRVLLALIRFYQKYISPMKRGGTCKYIPTCSEYARQAIEKHGALKGTVLAVWRLLRCNPFSQGGIDPVPEAWPRKH
ncbi:MAG: membrane protein insertion efficiency factor YidD [Lachnospiraceae bacterium]|nr:membrane protein insertion efficiency factor YidD [Lachnospiraceae bacterium]